MKKQLLTTTALVVAGMVVGTGAAYAQASKASKPTLTIGGWVEGIFGGASQDSGKGVAGVSKDVGWDSMYDSEFHFRGSVTLDNGIRIRTVAELEGETSGDQWDEAWIAISGSFGEVRVGSEDTAQSLMVDGYGAIYGVGVGRNLGKDLGKWLIRPTGAISPDTDSSTGDGNKITYFTPRIEGFQLGVSYIPSEDECAVSGTKDATCNSAIATVSSSDHNGYSVAANFDRKFNKLRVGVAGGYTEMKDAAGTVPRQSPNRYSVGALLEFEGIKVAGNYLRIMNSGTSDKKNFDIGANYKFGKNSVSAVYAYATSPGDRTVAGDDKTKGLVLSYRRDLGPGVQYRLDFMWSDVNGEAVGTTDDNDGYAITTSVRVDF